MTVRTRSVGLAVMIVGAVAVGSCGAPATAPPVAEQSTSAAPVATTTPAPTASGPRPGNGDSVVAPKPGGEGKLKVDNGTTADTYVRLVDGRTVVASMYVHSNATATLDGIPDGTYELVYSTGSGWNQELREFTADVSASKFDDTFEYTTDSSSTTSWSISLEPSVGGNASTSDIDPGSLPG